MTAYDTRFLSFADIIHGKSEKIHKKIQDSEKIHKVGEHKNPAEALPDKGERLLRGSSVNATENTLQEGRLLQQ